MSIDDQRFEVMKKLEGTKYVVRWVTPKFDGDDFPGWLQLLDDIEYTSQCLIVANLNVISEEPRFQDQILKAIKDRDIMIINGP